MNLHLTRVFILNDAHPLNSSYSTHKTSFSGSRSALINMEAKGEAANMISRRCVVVRWRDLTIEKFQNLIERGAGSILILLPPMNSSGDNRDWEVGGGIHL